MSAVSIYLSITAIRPEDRHVLSEKLVEASGYKLKDVGGGTGFGEDAESDIDFQTDETDPEEIGKLVAFLWKAVGPITEGQVQVFRISVNTGVR